MNPLEPPRVATTIIRRIVPGLYGEDFVTELQEEFSRRADRGWTARWIAHLWYWSQAVSLNTLRLRWGVLERERRRLQQMSLRLARRNRLDSVAQDIRDAVRSIRKSPAYAATVVATFALAVGANVAVFSVVNGVLLRPLPYANPGELVMIHRVSVRGGIHDGGVSGPDFRDWQRETTSFSSLAAYTRARETYFGEDQAEEWLGVETTPELFEALGVSPLLGRTLQTGVDVPMVSATIVLSHALWQRWFNSDSSVIGRTIRFEDRTMTVVGVMPAEFYFPTPAEQYWATLGSFGQFENRSWWFLRTIGRLSADVEISEAQREMSAIARRIDQGLEGDEHAAGVYLETRHESYVGATKRLFAILLGAVAVVLAIACANIANLGLTRAATRQREFAIRAAVGAARFRLIRQLLAENLALALMGAAVGVGIAHAGVRGLLAIGPANLPRQGDIGVDAVVLLFATAIAVACGLIFGLVPALHASRLAVTDGLRDRGPGVSSGIRRNNTLKMLVVAQIGLSQVLVVAAGLLLNSFLRLSAVRPGFGTDHTLTMQIHLPRDGYNANRVVEFHGLLAERLEALPGVHRAGLTSHLPFSKSDMDVTYFLPGDVPPGDRSVQLEVISEDYLETMGIPLLLGRHFDSSDRPDKPLVALINQRMAEMHWAGTSPIGRRFTIDDVSADDKWMTVVGVVGTVLKRGLTDDERPLAYLSLPQFHGHYSFVSGRHVYLAVRAAGVPENMVQSVQREIAALDARVAITDIRSTAGLVADSTAEPRFRTILIGSFAVLSLMVALVGIYGVMGFVVAQRRQEMGVRMALGASSAGVLKHVLLGGTRLIVLGVAVGTVVAVVTSRVLSGMLFGITPGDPITFSSVTALLVLVALGACYIPARRASRVDPMGVLRVD